MIGAEGISAAIVLRKTVPSDIEGLERFLDDQDVAPKSPIATFKHKTRKHAWLILGNSHDDAATGRALRA